jgi:hypothetical protein
MLQPFELLCRFGNGLMGRSLFGRHGTGDGFDQLGLPMQQVGGVMRFQIMFHRGQQSGGLIAGRLDDSAMPRCQSRCHACIPAGLIACLRQLFHNDEVALGVHGDEAQAAGEGCVLGDGEVFVGHRFGHAWGLALGIGDNGWLNVDVDRLLSPIGGRHKAVEAGEGEEETHQAHAAGANFDADSMKSHHASVEERESRAALQESGDLRTDSEAVVPPTPGVKRRSGHLEFLGGLTLGEALSSPRPVRRKEVGTFASIPAWLATVVALWQVLDDGSHRDLLGPSLAFD